MNVIPNRDTQTVSNKRNLAREQTQNFKSVRKDAHSRPTHTWGSHLERKKENKVGAISHTSYQNKFKRVRDFEGEN